MTFVEILACFVFSMDIKKERGANRFVFQLVRSRNVETVYIVFTIVITVLLFLVSTQLNKIWLAEAFLATTHKLSF